jgi:hypothetical protein
MQQNKIHCFYEHDKNFERLWNTPNKYLNKLKKFKGVISPDFSLYRNMPLVMQMWNTYRGRALAIWLQDNGVQIIPNVRFNDERTYEFCFCGIEKYSTVAIGTHGCIKKNIDKKYFKNGLENARPAKHEIIIGKHKWISKQEWQSAIRARKNGTATSKQKEILDNGHWKEK